MGGKRASPILLIGHGGSNSALVARGGLWMDVVS